MPTSKHIRFLESFHIPLWLLKDTFWMLQFKPLAIIMIGPTVLVALGLAWITRRRPDVFLANVAVCFWISANALWMLDEFYAFRFKPFALLFFVSGILVISYFFLKIYLKRSGAIK